MRATDLSICLENDIPSVRAAFKPGIGRAPAGWIRAAAVREDAA